MTEKRAKKLLKNPNKLKKFIKKRINEKKLAQDIFDLEKLIKNEIRKEIIPQSNIFELIKMLEPNDPNFYIEIKFCLESINNADAEEAFETLLSCYNVMLKRNENNN